MGKQISLGNGIQVFPNDGALALALLNSSGFNESSNLDVAVFLNDGTGAFAGLQGYFAGASCEAMATADLNRDGSTDLAALNQGLCCGRCLALSRKITAGQTLFDRAAALGCAARAHAALGRIPEARQLYRQALEIAACFESPPFAPFNRCGIDRTEDNLAPCDFSNCPVN